MPFFLSGCFRAKTIFKLVHTYMFNPMATCHGGENIFKLNLRFFFPRPNKVVNMKIALLGSKKNLKKNLAREANINQQLLDLRLGYGNAIATNKI